MLRPEARLVILDEPFRGLDRQQRKELLARARKLWQKSTLLCITHDLSETQTFGQVLIVERGRIVENGTPRALMKRQHGRYQAMLKAEKALQKRIWSSESWRRFKLEAGKLIDWKKTTNARLTHDDKPTTTEFVSHDDDERSNSHNI